jgi:ABC-type nitrate/sulfonate/bicarbonate transport system permease component
MTTRPVPDLNDAPDFSLIGDVHVADDLRVDAALRRRRLPRPNWWQSLLSVMVGIVIWQCWVDWFHPNPYIWKSPTEVWDAARIMWEAGTLGPDIWASLQNFTVGFFIGFGVGAVVGVALGSSRRLNTILGPWVTIFYSIPIIVLAPLVIAWLGFDAKARILIVAVAAFFPVVINTRAGVQSTGRGFQDVCTAFGSSRVERYRDALIPGAAPYILAGVRLALGRGLIAVVFADIFGALEGLGYVLASANSNARLEGVYVVAVILAILGLSFNGIVTYVERRFASYWTVG